MNNFSEDTAYFYAVSFLNLLAQPVAPTTQNTVFCLVLFIDKTNDFIMQNDGLCFILLICLYLSFHYIVYSIYLHVFRYVNFNILSFLFITF